MMGIDLDTTRQKDLYEQACRDMADWLPGWSDQFPSDPAVAVLEHLTYLSDIQNFALNQVGDVHYLAYCRLLGASPRRLTPARLLAVPNPDVSCDLGQRFYIEGIPFEVTKAPRNNLPQVVQVSFQSDGSIDHLGPESPITLGGRTPARLLLELSGPLPAGEPCGFWCSLAHGEGRIPPEEGTPPPVELRTQIRSGGQWLDAPCEDGTCGFLRSGPVAVTPGTQADAVSIQITGTWEGTPELWSAVLEPVELLQQHTRSICFELEAPFALPEPWLKGQKFFYFTSAGNGWRREEGYFHEAGRITGWSGKQPDKIRVVAIEPDFRALHALTGLAMEELHLEEDGVWPDSLRVMTEENGVWYDCPVCQPATGKTLPRGCRWEAERHCIRFGDGRDYLPPAPGQALVSNCILTLGSSANGAGGTLSDGDAVLATLAAARGGQDSEQPKDAFARAAREQEEPLRAVTCQDYEALARRVPGLSLKQVRAIPKTTLDGTGPGVVVLAKPVSSQPRPELSPWQRTRLSAFLEPYRLLGVPLEIRGPSYCPVRVRVTLLTSEPVEEETLRQAVLCLTDGVEGPLDFGAEISYTALYAALGGVEGVRFLRKLELTPLVSGVIRTRDGSILPGPDMLPCLAEFDVLESE